MAAARCSINSFPIEGDLTHSPAGARYASVLERLLGIQGSSRQVLVTSAGESEGKTVTAVNLAFAMNARRIRVLLAELTFMRPRFSKIFGTSPLSRGVEDVLVRDLPLNTSVCIRNDNNLNLTMVKRPQETNGLLLPGSRLDRFLADARNSYDWTVFDAPSIDSIPDIKALAASMGIVVLVVRARHTRSQVLKEALAQLDHTNTFILLNGE